MTDSLSARMGIPDVTTRPMNDTLQEFTTMILCTQVQLSTPGRKLVDYIMTIFHADHLIDFCSSYGHRKLYLQQRGTADPSTERTKSSAPNRAEKYSNETFYV